MGGAEVRALERRAAEVQRMFDECVRANDADGALRHSDVEEKLIKRLMDYEPTNDIHHFMLGRVYYNRAHILDSIGDGLAAWAMAGNAVSEYMITDPVLCNAYEVRGFLKRHGRDHGAEAERLIACAADARMRRAWILAKHRGRAEAESCLADAERALAVYKKLVRHGDHTPRFELRRIQAQYDDVRRFVR